MDIGPHSALAHRSASARAHLLVAAQFVRTGKVGGAEQMLYNLLRGIAANDADATILCTDPARLDTGFVAEATRTPGLSLHAQASAGSRFVAEQRAVLDPTLRADAILFPNYYVPPVVPARLGQVWTVLHDLQYRHHPHHFTARKRAWLRAAHSWALRRADRVFVISDFVRRDVMRLHGDRAARRLRTAPNPICWQRFADHRAPPGPPIAQPYILSVAAQYPHKNLATLIDGFALLARRDPDIQLVLCGQEYANLHGVGGARVNLQGLVQATGLADRILLTGYQSDAALGRWFRHAALFAFPSIFEGFGMPPVEALGFGLPVLTTGLTALAEVTLGLDRVVDDPLNPSAWASHMEGVLREGARARLSDDQVARVRHAYAPQTCAARYLAELRG